VCVSLILLRESESERERSGAVFKLFSDFKLCLAFAVVASAFLFFSCFVCSIHSLRSVDACVHVYSWLIVVVVPPASVIS